MRTIREFGRTGTRSPEMTEAERNHRAVSRRIAAEGFVLLKNDGILPLPAGASLGFFGGGSAFTIKGGIGSGEVNDRGTVSIVEGMQKAGFSVADPDWLADYRIRYQKAREKWRKLVCAAVNPWVGYTTHPFRLPDGRKIGAKDVAAAAASVYVVSRTAGEGSDRRLEAGDYYLTDREQEDLRALKKLGQKIILLLNVGGVIDLARACVPDLADAVLLIGQPGQEAGNAAADVLSGKVSPSGRLTDTWAVRFSDYPSSGTFSHLDGNVDTERYTEGIYVGYRYFDTFGVRPLYPFGFGLSYTQFALRNFKIRTDRLEQTAARAVAGKAAGVTEITMTGEVVNIGSACSGKEVVQLYVYGPSGRIPTEKRRLAGFAKTRCLAPGERTEVTILCPVRNLASFDEEKSAWVIGEGTYYFTVEDGSGCYATVGGLRIPEQVLEKVPHVCPLREPLKEMAGPEDEPVLPGFLRAAAAAAEFPVISLGRAVCTETVRTEDDIDRAAKEIASKLSAEEMLPMITGETGGSRAVIGSASVRLPGGAGETSHSLYRYGVPSAIMADGPAGLRLVQYYEVNPSDGTLYNDFNERILENGFFTERKEHPGAVRYYQIQTSFPVGTVLAQTWNTECAEDFGRAVAEEMLPLHVSLWLAPGMNIHRNPLCGRNFEYYSEDPLITGKFAAAVTRGVQSTPGTGVTIKHFACNSQEDNRFGEDSVVSERALREIYLRGFEIAVREAHPRAIMTSYNKINGVHSANSFDLCTELARREWGFHGLIMTDWGTTMAQGGSSPAACIAAGNDLMMPGSLDDCDRVREGLENGMITVEQLRCCAEHVINAALRSAE